MNEIIDNNFGATKNFINKYKNSIIIFISLLVFIAAIFIFNSYNTKIFNEKAAAIYNQWINQPISLDEGSETKDDLYNNLVNNYSSSGYAMMAMLSRGADSASKGDFENAINAFILLRDASGGFTGNKFFNKISRISLSRIYLETEMYEEAFSQLSIYSEDAANAYIHELIGDIFAAQGKNKRSIEQYKLANEKYSDQQSKSIVAMKIADLKS